MHHSRKVRGQDMFAPPFRVPKGDRCTVKGCPRKQRKRQLCSVHYTRYLNGQDLAAPIRRFNVPLGSTRDRRGYVAVKVRRGGPPQDQWEYEHRIVMACLLGRDLRPEESVHHRDGDKANNHPDNLELWAKGHPAGQRVREKVAWAREIIALYGDDPGRY